MFLALAALALAALLQSGLTWRLEQARMADSQLVEEGASRRTLAQQLGRQTALLLAEPAHRRAHAETLGELLHDAAQDAQRLERSLSRQGTGERAGAMAASLDAWRSARDRLWADARALHEAAGGAPDRQGSDEVLLARAAAVQAGIEPVLVAAQRLSASLRDAAQAHALRLRQQVFWGTAGMLLLLGVLFLGVVEPTVRALARHQRGLAEQSSTLRRLAMVAERTTALVVISDVRDRIIWVNEAFTQACGWSLEEARLRTPAELAQHPAEDPTVRQRLQQALAQGAGLRHEGLWRAREGRDLWLDIDLRPVFDSQGRLDGFVRVATDITTRMQQQGKLQALWAALPAGVLVHDAAGTIVDGNAAAARMFGMDMAQLRGQSPHDGTWRVLHEDLSDCPMHELPALRTLRNGQALFNQALGVVLPGGGLRWLLVNTEPQFGAQGEVSGVITCFTDITESRLLQQQLQAHARTDALTQLPNRTVVMERLQRAVSHARRHPGYGFALLFMDFDRFKQVNDTLGHGAGDALLRQVAERLQRALRPGDAVMQVDTQLHVAARIGGDEFVVVLDGVADEATVAVIANRLLEDLGEPFVLGSSPVQTSASIGVVLHRHAPPQAPDDELPALETVAEELLRNADTAMYEAKRAGRGRWVLFDDSMHERVVRVMALETDLRRALRDDELFVAYQPIVDLASRAAVGVEALVRWRHPERGVVLPAEFIGVAEECGLIDAVGDSVLRKACTQFMHWQRGLGTAAPQQLAVNLSRAQLKRAGMVEETRAVLLATGMPAERLQLEVTESLAAQDEKVQATLRELKGLGLKLALDDFGTGYSSLACLNLMPVDTVKIDRSFVRHAESVEYQRVLIEATIRVARTLGMLTVAEGIETAAEAALMQRLECDRGQGYLFARPLLPAELEDWLRCRHNERVEPLATG